MSKSKTTTRFFSLTGSELSCETRCGNQSLVCRIELKNGSFFLERSSYCLLDAVEELRLYLSVCERILKDNEL